jgi:hypothetical protein
MSKKIVHLPLGKDTEKKEALDLEAQGHAAVAESIALPRLHHHRRWYYRETQWPVVCDPECSPPPLFHLFCIRRNKAVTRVEKCVHIPLASRRGFSKEQILTNVPRELTMRNWSESARG